MVPRSMGTIFGRGARQSAAEYGPHAPGLQVGRKMEVYAGECRVGDAGNRRRFAQDQMTYRRGTTSLAPLSISTSSLFLLALRECRRVKYADKSSVSYPVPVVEYNGGPVPFPVNKAGNLVIKVLAVKVRVIAQNLFLSRCIQSCLFRRVNDGIAIEFDPPVGSP